MRHANVVDESGRFNIEPRCRTGVTGVPLVHRELNRREFLRPSSSRFLAIDSWSEPNPSTHVLTTGWRHPAIHRGATRIALYIWRGVDFHLFSRPKVEPADLVPGRWLAVEAYAEPFALEIAI